MPRDLARGMSDEVAARHRFEVFAHLRFRDAERLQLGRGRLAAHLDALVDQLERRAGIVGARLEELGRAFEQIPQQLALPVGPGLLGRGANVGEGEQVEIAQQ